ncbi:kelch repeat-containing protein [Streptomyces sp. NBC_01619]|uniref:Kelch repeat-containing protein n=1 Tax=Streptomyces sp. NBC_01619 TaxID=2975901 RepID=UPI00338E97EF
MPTARAFLAGATAPCPQNVDGLKGTCVYAIGGIHDEGLLSDAVEAYSPATNTWVTLPSLPAPRSNLAATTAPCPQNVDGLKGTCVYAIGGIRGENPLLSSVVEAYSPATNTWVTLPSMPTRRSFLSAATTSCPQNVDGLDGTCVYAIGGRDLFAALNTVEAYSPATNTWATLPSMPTARAGLQGSAAHCPQTIDGLSRTACVYAIGGFDENSPALNTVEAYNPASNTWTALPSMPTARALLAGAGAACPRLSDEKKPATLWGTVQGSLLGNPRHRPTCVYAAGGAADNSTPLDTLEAYNPAMNSWATLPSLPTARFGLAGAAAPCPDRQRHHNGRRGHDCIYAIGGTPDNGETLLNTTEAFDTNLGLIRFDGHSRSGAQPREDVHHGEHGEEETSPPSPFVHAGVQGRDRRSVPTG